MGPDPIHTTFSLFGISLLKGLNLREVNPILGIPLNKKNN